MPTPPSWWRALAAPLAEHRHPIYAADVVATTARLILTTTTSEPRTLLAHARNDAPELVGALTDFFRTHGHLDPPADLAGRRAAARRARRIEATPAPLRPQVRGFADSLLHQREQAQQLGLRPNQLKTVEIRLDAVRDLALHLYAEGHVHWASVTTAQLESFLALAPARRASRLAGLRQFFAYAHRAKAVLHNPADPVTAVQQRGFNGPTLALAQQRALYRRWTTKQDIHPHEAFAGLAALLHAATITELRLLTDTAIDPDHQSVQFPGRSVALPLDDATWGALQRCQEHRRRLGSDNPHLLVTRLTRTRRSPAGAAHVRDSLAPVGLLPRILRSTRLLTLADELDIKVLTTSLGMSYAGVAHYRPGTTPPASFM
ncbi:integrase [Streptomyces sp. NPDC002888]|uniref:integrase n=1 Tax=Streptomyces sp. NPDC002888 TaxID=3364668 RepID=UPI00368AE38B